MPGRECSWQQKQHVQRPWGGTCLISYRSSKEAIVARSEGGCGESKRGSQQAPGALKVMLSTLHSVPSLQMCSKDIMPTAMLLLTSYECISRTRVQPHQIQRARRLCESRLHETSERIDFSMREDSTVLACPQRGDAGAVLVLLPHTQPTETLRILQARTSTSGAHTPDLELGDTGCLC